VKKTEENQDVSMVREDETPIMKTFSSQEEAE
jgi:hypothetical protein